MSKLLIEGGHRLNGEMTLQGAKNSVLPILAACLLCEGTCVIHNCPDLTDVHASGEILRSLGCSCSYNDGTMTVRLRSFSRYSSVISSGTSVLERSRKNRRSSLLVCLSMNFFSGTEAASRASCVVSSSLT